MRKRFSVLKLFSAIDLIYHLGISESFFPIFFACALIILSWILISIWFKDEDEKCSIAFHTLDVEMAIDDLRAAGS